MPRQAMLNVASAALFCTGSNVVACGSRIPVVLSRHTLCVPAVRICKLHAVSCCPAFVPQQYVTHRIVKAVVCGLKRLGLKKTQSILQYLGVSTWSDQKTRASTIKKRERACCVCKVQQCWTSNPGRAVLTRRRRCVPERMLAGEDHAV
jgi:hypothetical protein